jgi:hypothetical protein
MWGESRQSLVTSEYAHGFEQLCPTRTGGTRFTLTFVAECYIPRQSPPPSHLARRDSDNSTAA